MDKQKVGIGGRLNIMTQKDKPKQIKITDGSPLEGALSFISALGRTGDIENMKKEALTDKFDDITVDTCCPTDTHVWETGILRESLEGKWVIVSQYHSKEEAEEGHQAWVAYMKENPDCELKDIDNWNLSKVSAREV